MIYPVILQRIEPDIVAFPLGNFNKFRFSGWTVRVPSWRECAGEAAPRADRLYLLRPHIASRKAEFVARFLENNRICVTSSTWLDTLCRQYNGQRRIWLCSFLVTILLSLTTLVYTLK